MLQGLHRAPRRVRRQAATELMERALAEHADQLGFRQRAGAQQAVGIRHPAVRRGEGRIVPAELAPQFTRQKQDVASAHEHRRAVPQLASPNIAQTIAVRRPIARRQQPVFGALVVAMIDPDADQRRPRLGEPGVDGGHRRRRRVGLSEPEYRHRCRQKRPRLTAPPIRCRGRYFCTEPSRRRRRQMDDPVEHFAEFIIGQSEHGGRRFSLAGDRLNRKDSVPIEEVTCGAVPEWVR